MELSQAAADSALEGEPVFPFELLVFKASTREELHQLVKNTKDELIGASRPDLREIAAAFL